MNGKRWVDGCWIERSERRGVWPENKERRAKEISHVIG
jgi:hypothetical protein